MFKIVYLCSYIYIYIYIDDDDDDDDDFELYPFKRSDGSESIYK